MTSPSDKSGGMERVRDDLMDLTQTAVENDADPRITKYPNVVAVVSMIVGLILSIVLAPAFVIEKIHSNKYTGTLTAIPIAIIGVGIAAGVSDVVAEMKEAHDEFGEMGNPIFFACHNCGVAPIEMVDASEIEEGESPGHCDNCGALLQWDWRIPTAPKPRPDVGNSIDAYSQAETGVAR